VRVLCVNDLAPGGASGAEVHLALLVEGLRAAGDEVECFSLPLRSGMGRLSDVWSPAARTALEQAIRAFRPEVLHFHNVVRELSVAVLTAAPALPRVMTVHDGRLLGDADAQGSTLRAWQRLRSHGERRVARRHGGPLLAVSDPLRSRLLSAGFPDVVHAAPWAERPSATVTAPASCRDVVFLGRLDRDKGVAGLVEAFLDAAGPSSRLVLAGSGSFLPPPDPRVLLTGRLDRAQVSALLGSARLVALPSLSSRRPEGSPLALVEALVHGRPLLVSDDPGCAALARPDAPSPAGVVVPAGDIPALSAALSRLLQDDALVTRLAAGAALAAQEHTVEVGIARVRAAYAQALA
jgi:glycosyltransferase involved in cell wall biosynthesis